MKKETIETVYHACHEEAKGEAEEEEKKETESIRTAGFTAAEKGLLKTQFTNLDKKPEIWEQSLSDEVKELKCHIREKFDLNKTGKPTMPVLFYAW